jgi:hypothetical protein
MFDILQELSGLLAKQNAELYALDLHKAFASYEGVTENLCREHAINDMKLRDRAIPKVWNSLLNLNAEIGDLLSRNLSDISRDFLLVGSKPNISEIITQSFGLLREILNGLSPLAGSASSHLKSINNLMKSAQETLEAVDDLNHVFHLLDQAYVSIHSFEGQLHQFLASTNQLRDHLRLPIDRPNHVNAVILLLSDACALRHHVQSAKSAFLRWKESLHQGFTLRSLAQILPDIDNDLQNISRLRTRTQRILQVMKGRETILFRFESLSNMTEKAQNFVGSLNELDIALSSQVPSSSLMRIDEDVKIVYRELHAFYLESLALTCQDLSTDNTACNHSNENAFSRSTSLERAKTNLLQKFSTLKQSFSEGLSLSEQFSEIIGPMLESVSREASELSVAALESYEIALKMMPDNFDLFGIIGTSSCSKDKLFPHFQRGFKETGSCPRAQKKKVENILNALHFAASDIHTAFQNQRVVIGTIGDEIAILSQKQRKFSFMNFSGALDQLPVDSLRSSWLGICTFAPHAVTSDECMCVHNELYYSSCSEKHTLQKLIAKAYETETAYHQRNEDENLLMSIDMFFLLVRSNQDSEQENVILEEFLNLCQATSDRDHSNILVETLAAVKSICQIEMNRETNVQSQTDASLPDAFPHDFGEQAASLRLDIQRAVNDVSMASIFDKMILFDQQISLLDTMITDVRGAEMFAVALRDVDHQSLGAIMNDLTKVEKMIIDIRSQNLTELSCSQRQTFEELNAKAWTADVARQSMWETKPLLQHDLELLAGHGMNPESHNLPSVCSSSTCVQVHNTVASYDTHSFGQKYGIFADLLSHASFAENRTLFVEKGEIITLHSQYSIRASTFLGAQRLLVTMEPSGLRKLQGRASLLVLVRAAGNLESSVEKIFELFEKGESFKPFLGSVDGVAIVKQLLWICSENQGKIHGFAMSDILSAPSMSGPSSLHVHDTIDLRAEGIRASSIFFDAISLRLWVAEYSQPHPSFHHAGNPGLACGFKVDDNGFMQTSSLQKICLVTGEYVQGIALYQMMGKQIVALSRCIKQHQGSACKVEFHLLKCAQIGVKMNFRRTWSNSTFEEEYETSNSTVGGGGSILNNSGVEQKENGMEEGEKEAGSEGDQEEVNEKHVDEAETGEEADLQLECAPSDSGSGIPTWDITGPGNGLGDSLLLAVRIPPGARGLAFKVEEAFLGGYFLLCVSSSMSEPIDLHSTGGDLEDSIYIFASPIIFNEPLHVSRNSVYLKVLGRTIVDRPILNPSSLQIWKKRQSLFHWEFSLPIWGPLSVGFSLHASWDARFDLEFKMCFEDFSVTAALVPSARVDFDAKGWVSLWVIRGGIGVEATVLNTRIVPAVWITPFPGKRPTGIEFSLTMNVVPISVRVYAWVEFLCNIKWCWAWLIPLPCGLEWGCFFSATIVDWSMNLMEIKGPSLGFSFMDITPPLPGSAVAFQTSLSSLNIEWLGFSEIQSEIWHYFVCIGSAEDESDFMVCTNVGLSNSFQGQALRIPHGTQVFVTIRYILPLTFFLMSHKMCILYIS